MAPPARQLSVVYGGRPVQPAAGCRAGGDNMPRSSAGSDLVRVYARLSAKRRCSHSSAKSVHPSSALLAILKTASDDVFARHGSRHPLGEGFSGSQDLVPHAFDEQTALAYAAQVPPPVVREVFLSGTPDEVIDQAAQWRDQGARHIVLADVSSLQRSLRNGLAATISFGKILRGLKKL